MYFIKLRTSNGLFKNIEYQKDAINNIKGSKIIPKEFIDIVNLIEQKLIDLDDLIQFNKYFINIKKKKICKTAYQKYFNYIYKLYLNFNYLFILYVSQLIFRLFL